MSFVEAVKSVDTSNGVNNIVNPPTLSNDQENLTASHSTNKFLGEDNKYKDIFSLKPRTKASISVYSIRNKTTEVIRNFIITNTTKQSSVSNQINDTFDRRYFRFYGENAIHLTVDGVIPKSVINSEGSDDWVRDFKLNYIDKLKFSKTFGKIVSLSVNDRVYFVKIMSLNLNTVAETSDMTTSFSMSIIITGEG